MAQIDCRVSDSEANCNKIVQFINEAGLHKCDVVFFPEMSDTGYVPSKFRETAQPWSGSTFKTISEAARAAKVAVVAGMSELEGDKLYNSIACIDHEGQLVGKYRKLHLFSPEPASEDQVCTAGSAYALVELKGVRFGLSICYDLRFPEMYRAMRLAGADVLVNCSAWPKVRVLHWDILCQARAIENQCFFIGVSRVGQDEDFVMSGSSRVVGPQGEVLVQAGMSEGLTTSVLDLTELASLRTQIPISQSRRPDIYGQLGS